MKAPRAESSTGVYREADLRAVGAIQLVPKLKDNMRQVALYANWHNLLERATSCQDLHVNYEDVTRTMRPRGITFFRLYTQGCDG